MWAYVGKEQKAMNEIQVITAKTALKNMFRKGHMSVCTIENIIKMNPLLPVDKDSLQMLHLLNCVDFNEMPEELLRGLPVLIQKTIGNHLSEDGDNADWIKELAPFLRIA